MVIGCVYHEVREHTRFENVRMNKNTQDLKTLEWIRIRVYIYIYINTQVENRNEESAR